MIISATSKWVRFAVWPAATLTFIVVAFVALSNLIIIRAGEAHVTASAEDAPKSQAAVVLGAKVFDDSMLSHVLADRLDAGVELYRAGKVDKLLLTGDHGQVRYDEVNAMRKYALSKGIPAEDIFMDHAGFDTYDSMYRARDVFEVKSAVVVTQRFHLARSVYIARALGIDATGVSADKHVYMKADMFEIREAAARVKAFFELHITRPKPRFLGEKIPITGDGRRTND
ncbi:MAG: ElyC/SanA/YdcF family protein [Actinomycetota bacterium]|nr:ElyC/SanA/YdcF family protein [Actinomycetota bacterium]